MKGQPSTKPQGHKPKQALKRGASNAVALLENTGVAPPADWFKHWWRDWPLFSLAPADNDYYASPRPKLEKAFEWFWKPNRIAAWAYELVRRLVKTKVPTPSEMKVLRELPPYPQLDPRCREAIKAAVGEIYGWGTVLLNRAGLDLRPFKYSEPIPPWSFDLQCGEKAPLDIVRQWLELQAEAAGIPKKTGKKGSKSRNRNQTSLLGDWSLVEMLENPAQTKPKRRKLAIGHARKFKDRVLDTWQWYCEAPGCLSPAPTADEIPNFTVRQFKQERFMEIFQAATKQFPIPHNPPA